MWNPVSANAAMPLSASDPSTFAAVEAGTLLLEHTLCGVLQTQGLAEALSERAQSDPTGAEALIAAVQARLPLADQASLEREMAALEEPGAAEAGDTRQVTGMAGANEITWTLDAEGRTIQAEATLREVFTGADRDSEEVAAQSRVGRSGIEGDHGGHIIAHRFSLNQGEINMFPQNGNFNMSAYRTMENELAAWVDAGGEVQVDVRLHDIDGGRPSEVEVIYEVTNPETGDVVYRQHEFFENAEGQVFDRVPSGEMGELMEQVE
jgi:hypothetical protein